ncbi:hypothetical protein JD844_023446 [Phrynosoma platyrhinos]|uniref:G-protein coupled receptors family 1 profile domain-containing protein n=1 Tax=Phrynosoma platyrhinos TaxID=52577 RepID=A0ABQ7SX15_PHRPL|nr:hypothetical protein JD844_023446 [Phrynosoma platyrhinos]
MEEHYISKLHPTWDYGAGVFLLFIAILTILGNSVVLAVAVKRSSHLRSPELLTVNLAVTDLGMAISMYPLAIASAWNHAWLGGDATCIYYALMGFLFGVSSMMTLSVMAVIRFLVTHSSKSNTMTIITCYFGIAWKVHKTYQEMQNFNRISSAAKLEKKLTLMAILISVGFLSAWTPYATVSFWSIFHSSESIPYIVTLLPCLFAKSSTAYNPFIYYTFSKTFRHEVKQLQCCCGQKIHFFNTKNSINSRVSVIWPGGGDIHIYSAPKTDSGNIPNQ